MTSLNPVLTIGYQISEALRVHHDISKEDAIRRTWNLLEMVGIPQAKERYTRLSASIFGGYAPAGDDRHGSFLQSQHPDR